MRIEEFEEILIAFSVLKKIKRLQANQFKDGRGGII
jgi:hypothetical protein